MNPLVSDIAEKFGAPGADKGLLISQLEDTRLPDAARFLAQVAATELEEDYVRTEAIRALSCWEFRQRDLLLEVGASMLNTAMSSMDDLVKTHATMALGHFIECPGTLEQLSRVVLDLSQDEDLRHNALESLRANIHLPNVRVTLRRAAQQADSIGRAAKRYLVDTAP